MSEPKLIISTIGAGFGAMISFLCGQQTTAFTALLICMLVDILSGICIAVLKKSPKSDTGRLSSKSLTAGLFKKLLELSFIAVANWIGKTMSIIQLRDAVIYFFLAGELLSLIENGGLLGIKYPKKIYDLIDLLQDKEYDA